MGSDNDSDPLDDPTIKEIPWDALQHNLPGDVPSDVEPPSEDDGWDAFLVHLGVSDEYSQPDALAHESQEGEGDEEYKDEKGILSFDEVMRRMAAILNRTFGNSD